jgi:hypothetical protein
MITLPGQTHIVVWGEDKYKSATIPDDLYKWYGELRADATPPTVDIWKKCSLTQYSVHISVTLSEISIEADGDVRFTLLEASDFSIAMIEAIRTLKAAEAHAKGELYGPHSDGDIRYE